MGDSYFFEALAAGWGAAFETFGRRVIHLTGSVPVAPMARLVRATAPGPIHRRGKFKPNARRQKGRKVLPRRPHG